MHRKAYEMLYLIRHGEENQTVRGGWSRSALTDIGVLQAERLARSIRMNPEMHVCRIFSSDLPRAVQTAERLAQALSLPVTAAPQFREINNGLLADMGHVQAERQFPGLYYRMLAWDEHYPNGESPHAFFDRIASAWKTFKQIYEDAEGDTLLVTHGGVIQIIYCLETGISYTNQHTVFSVPNAGLLSIESMKNRDPHTV